MLLLLSLLPIWVAFRCSFIPIAMSVIMQGSAKENAAPCAFVYDKADAEGNEDTTVSCSSL